MDELARIVKRERLRRGMRGIDLAYAIGKDPGYVTKMEHGTLKEIPAPEIVHALSAALGIDETEIVRAIGFTVVASERSATSGPGDPVAELVATFTPRQRRMLLDLLDRASDDEPDAATADAEPRRTASR